MQLQNAPTMRVVLKLGGSSLVDPETRRAVIETVRGFRKYDHSVVVVHGGGPSINQALTAKGLKWQFIQGQRQTTPEMMGVIEDVLAGEINKALVDDMNAGGVPCVGFSGAESETLLCEQASQELGQVGRILEVNTLWIERLLSASGCR
jgi:acetylglutamate kinase